MMLIKIIFNQYLDENEYMMIDNNVVADNSQMNIDEFLTQKALTSDEDIIIIDSFLIDENGNIKM